ncbi:MAG: ABC transporter ATP-binding protein [Puniceicoccales bacterium]|jgi:peptide/nickel transport system ATP-binding protein|nr:ABC transporter ATP-binding protein [Puniceicoccales bacterium]
MKENQLLSVENLSICFSDNPCPTVENINFTIFRGKTLALVGESGSGKTLIANCLMRLLPNVLIKGTIVLEKQSILNLSLKELIEIRKNRVAYIFQEPGAMLNPSLTVGYQLMEIVNEEGRKKQVLGMLERVGFTDPKKIFRSYPHELSGGMQQRVMIAMALINHPPLLIADEPTTALDVVLQKQILDLIQDLQKEFSFSMLLITHDFSLLQQLADDVCVLRAGKIIERGQANDIIFNPQNDYTKLLAQSIFTLLSP